MPILLRNLLKSIFLSAVLCACAVQQTATLISLVPAGDSAAVTLSSPLELQLRTGYHRTLKQGSRWTRIGSVPQGDVYKPYRDVFTIEGAHMHEAYLVVDKGMLVGFYLPAERGYADLGQRKPIFFQ